MSKYIFSTKDKRGGGVGEQGPPLFWLESDDAEILTSEMHEPYTRTTGA